jgi:hypothetical protein
MAAAQDTLSKWTFGVIGGVEFNYTRVQAEDNEELQNIWDSLESPVWRGTGGLRVAYKFNKKIDFFVGINYANRGYFIDTLEEAGFHNLIYHYRYLEIPVGASFSLSLNKKNELLFSLAATPRFLISEKIDYEKIGQSAIFEMENTSVQNKSIMNVNAGLGIRRHITGYSTLDLIFNGNQSLSPLSDGPLSRYLNSIGLLLVLSTRI